MARKMQPLFAGMMSYYLDAGDRGSLPQDYVEYCITAFRWDHRSHDWMLWSPESSGNDKKSEDSDRSTLLRVVQCISCIHLVLDKTEV
jgi:hypothetical protein